MNSNKRADASLTQIIIELVQKRKPQDTQQLINLVKEKTSVAEQEIINHIIRLQSKGKITLKESPRSVPQKLSGSLKTREANWYWITLIIAIVTTITVFTIPENAYPMVYIRYLLGTLFVIWLPGYSFIKASFPKTRAPFKASSRSLDTIERIALGIGVSLAIVPIVCFLLYHTPLGLRRTTIVLSLLALTTIFATIGIIREQRL